MKLRKIALIGLVAVVGVACSKGGSNPAGQGGSLFDLVSKSQAKTTAAGSSKVSLVVSVTSSQIPGGSLSINGQGAFDYANKTGELSLDIPNVGTIEERILGGKVFVKTPLNDKFIEMDLSQFSSSGTGLGTDPSQILSYLQGVSSSIKDLGQDTVRGQSMRHLQANIDLNKAAARLSGVQKDAFEKAVKLFGTNSLPVDVWIDSAGRVGKFSFKVDINAPSAGKASVSLDMELFDFGTTVNVQAPPASQVTQGPSGGLFG